MVEVDTWLRALGQWREARSICRLVYAHKGPHSHVAVEALAPRSRRVSSATYSLKERYSQRSRKEAGGGGMSLITVVTPTPRPCPALSLALLIREAGNQK